MAEDFSHMSPNKYQFGENKLHLQETEVPRNRKKPRPFQDNIRDFMSNTTLHGFRYILDEELSWVERLWWVIMVICSIVVCAFFIRQVYIKWDETPVIVSFADTSNSVWHIPFPAVTLCSETKPRQRVFNFTKAYFERWSNPSSISAEDLKTYQDMLLLCNNDNSDGPDFADISAIETLQRFIMPYKIVQTIQDEKLLLIAVPSQWENKGILKWPKKKFEKLRRNEESVPKEKWSPMNCIVKRKNLTLQQADDEIDYMCKNSDTENSENISCKTRKMQTTTIIESPNCSFNNLAEECEATNHHQRRFSSTAQNNNLIFITQENKNRFLTPVDAEIILDSTFIPNIATEKESTSSLNIMHSKIDSLNQNLKMLSENVISKIDLLTQNLKMLTEKVIVLQKNQLGLYDAEQNILLSLSNISTQLEEIVNKFLQPETNFKSKEISFDAISDKESFDLFEKKLQDSTYQEKLLEKMSLMCGTSRGKGINNAYALVDIIFARDFLQKCSWAGGSRSETAKICFKSHKNAVQFFFKVVNLADRSFSLLDTENFFKVILRNSRKRNESLRVRMSVTKTRVRRQKSITNQSVQEAQNSDIQQGQQQLVHQPFSAQPAQVLCSPDGQLQVLPESSCTESLG